MSPAGAVGIAQIVPADHPDVNPYNPFASLAYAAKWLRSLYVQFGASFELMLAAYNAGPGNVRKYDGIPPFPETEAYVKRIMGCAGLIPASGVGETADEKGVH